jgi:hypothetical protein
MTTRDIRGYGFLWIDVNGNWNVTTDFTESFHCRLINSPTIWSWIMSQAGRQTERHDAWEWCRNCCHVATCGLSQCCARTSTPPAKKLQLIHTAIYLSRIRIRFLIRSNAPIVVQEGTAGQSTRITVGRGNTSVAPFEWAMQVASSWSHLQATITFPIDIHACEFLTAVTGMWRRVVR